MRCRSDLKHLGMESDYRIIPAGGFDICWNFLRTAAFFSEICCQVIDFRDRLLKERRAYFEKVQGP